MKQLAKRLREAEERKCVSIGKEEIQYGPRTIRLSHISINFIQLSSWLNRNVMLLSTLPLESYSANVKADTTVSKSVHDWVFELRDWDKN